MARDTKTVPMNLCRYAQSLSIAKLTDAFRLQFIDYIPATTVYQFRDLRLEIDDERPTTRDGDIA